MRFPRRAILSILCTGPLTGLAACDSSPPPQRIVVVSLDTLRLDALLETDRHTSAMPRTWERAQEGALFTRHYAATSTTQPTHASLFTGRPPWQHGVARNGIRLGSTPATLAERLRAAGYETSAVVGSFPLHHAFGFDRGFDRYVDEFDEQENVERWAGVELPHGFFQLGQKVLESALKELDTATAARQFFFFHFYDVHAPYGLSAGAERVLTDETILELVRRGVATPDEAVRAARASYDLDAGYLDRVLERLFERLDRDRDRYETWVFLLADHGESFGEDGSVGHGRRLTEPEIHVPLVVLGPGLRPGRHSEPCGTVDVYATVLARAGLSDPGAAGRDLLAPGAAAGRVAGMRRTFAGPYEEERLDGSSHAILGPRFYLVDGDRVLVGDRTAVCEGDRAERVVTGPRADEARALFGQFQDELESVHADELVDPAIQRGLEALGYTRGGDH